VEEENLWGLEGHQQAFSALFYDLKEAVRMGKTGEDLAETIAQSPLLHLVQQALDDLELRETREERDQWKEKGESAAKAFDLLVQVAEVQAELQKPAAI